MTETTVSLDDILTTLGILRDQLKAKGVHETGVIEELNFTPRAVRLRFGSKTLHIPLVRGDVMSGIGRLVAPASGKE